MKLNAKYVTFSAISLASLYVLYHNERFLIDGSHPAWQHYAPFKWWLLPHGIFGAIVLLFAPLQFSERLRQRFTRAHRVIGRFYVAGVVVGAPLGIYIQYLQERMGDPRSFTIAGAADAAVWIVTTAIAMSFILKGKVQQHRIWMTRSFACSLIFLEVRVIVGLFHLPPQDIETVVWVCVVAAVPIADIALQIQESLRTRSAMAKAVRPLAQTV